MKKLVSSAIVALTVCAGSLLAIEPAAAITPADVVSSASTTVSGNCHGGQTANVYTNYVLFDADTFTLSLTNCNSHYALPNTWMYGSDYTKVNAGNGGTGVRNPNTYALGNDQQCLQQNATNSWGSVPYGFSGFTATMSDAVTSATGAQYVFVYDMDPVCGSGSYWHNKQLVYSLYPVTPTVTAAFGSAAVGVNTQTVMTVTLTNSQRYRVGVRGNYSGLGFDIALPSDANLDTGAAGGTCGGTVTATTPSGVNTMHYTGGALNNLTDSCTVTVPIAFSSAGSKVLTDTSLTSTASNRGALINDLSASVTVTSGPTLSPATQSPTFQARVGTNTSTALSPTGFSGTVAYSISPALPDGLTLDTTTGVISGTPTLPQNAIEYTITGTDGTDSATATVTLAIATAPPALYPGTQTLEAHVGEALSPSTAIDTSAMTCVVPMTISPDLPTGLSFDATTGVISGTPAGASSATDYTITYDCSGSGGNVYTSTVSLTVTAAPSPLPDINSLVNTGLSILGPIGVFGLLLAMGAPFFFVSERFRHVRATGAVILHRSTHLTISSPARFFDRLRRKH